VGNSEPGDLIGAVEALLEDRKEPYDVESNTCMVAIDQLDIVLAAVRPVVQELLAGQIAVLARQQDRVEEELASIARNVAGEPEKVSANGLDSMPPPFVRCESINPSGPKHQCALDENHDGEHMDGTLKWMVSRQTIAEAEAMHTGPGPAYCGEPSPHGHPSGLVCRKPKDHPLAGHQDTMGRQWT
jgi:hypothetical protein